MKILIMDDEEVIRNFIKDTLSGYEIEQASNGDDALNLYETHGPFDLVITDIAHGGLNGLDLVTAIRGIKPTQALILCSGAAVSKEFLQALQRRNIPYVSKPFRRDELLDAVKATQKGKLQ